MEKKMHLLPMYHTLVNKLNTLLTLNLKSSELEQFEKPTGSAENPLAIRPNFSGFSQNFNDGYGVTFYIASELSRHYNLQVQRIFPDGTPHDETVKLALEALIHIYEHPENASGKSYEHRYDYNVI